MVLIALVICPAAANGQEPRAKVRGQVTDSSGGTIIGAKITLLNVNTGVDTTRQTNESGLYLFDYVSGGTYSLAIESAGFGGFVQQNILVENLGDVTVNAVLQPGMTKETVTVTDTPPAVQFNSSSLHTELDTKMANDLPIMNRNVFLMAMLDPAVVIQYSSPQRAVYDLWAAGSVDIGGKTAGMNDLLVDGTPAMVGGKSSYQPPMDAVQGLSIQQNSVDAEFGHSAGGIVSIQMKSGTNEIHGTAYYMGRNPALNAVADSTNHTPNPERNHIAGGTIGMPLKKNRIFNFTAFERWLNNTPVSSVYTLPTSLERVGDFSKSLNAAGGLRQIFDPSTTQYDVAAGTSTRTPFSNNVIPASSLDPTAQTFMKDIWQPNNPGDDITGVNNFKSGDTVNINYWNLSNRTDFNVTEKWKVFFRYSQFHTTGVENAPVASQAWHYTNGYTSHSLQMSGDAVWTINPTTVFDGRFDYISIRDAFDAPIAEVNASGLAKFWPGNAWYTPYLPGEPLVLYPSLEFDSAAGTSQFGEGGYWYQVPKNYVATAKVSKQIRKHYAKIGGEYRGLRITAVRPNPGGFDFQSGTTAGTFVNPNTLLQGDPWATFLTGAIDNNSRAGTVPLQKPQTDYFGFYFQDDWKVSKRVTLNVGLRYEYEMAMRDATNRLSRYLDLTSPIPEFQSNPPQLPAAVEQLRESPPIYNGAWVFTDSSNRGSWNAQPHVFLPRVGFAYRVNDKTSLRAGWARYIIPPMVTTGVGTGALGSLPYPGFDATTYVAPALEGVPQASLSNPFPSTNPIIAPVGKALGRYTNLGGSTTWFNQDYKAGVNDRINFSLQRQLPWHLAVDATFYMNLGHDLSLTEVGSQRDLNQMDPQLSYTYQGALNATVPNPFYDILTPAQFPGQLRNQQYVSVGSLLTPYPQYGSLVEMVYPEAKDRYRAAQFKVQRPFAGGFTFTSGYSYNREQLQTFYDGLDRFNNRLTWQDPGNPRHRLTFGGVYDLPFGRGKRLLMHASRLLDGVVGGWSLGGIFLFNSGDLLQFDGAVVTGDPKIANPTRTDWFDTSMFSLLPAYTRSTNPVSYPGLTGPKFWNTDLSMSKTQPLTERIKLQLRLEAYNLTNSFMGADPSTDNTNSLFGQVVSLRQGTQGRELQYSVRLIF